MRKRIFGRRLKRDTNERKALFKSLMIGLITHGKIRTTYAKAKSINGEVEKLVTIGKTKGDDARRQLMSHLVNDKAADKILMEIAPLFKDRVGGYTRILRMGPRVKDGASMVLLTWTERVVPTAIKDPKRKTVKAAAVKSAAAKAAAKTPAKPKAGSKK